MSNTEIHNIAKKIKDRLDHAETSKDIDDILKIIKDYGKPLKYNNAFLYLISFIFAVCAFFSYYYLHEERISAPFIILAPIPFFNALNRNRQLNKLAKDIFTANLMIDNNMTSETPPSVDELSGRYSDFIRGDHSQHIEYFIKGTITKKEYTLIYYIYKFEYVCEYKHVDSKGHVRTTNITRYRYGVILDDFTIDNIQVIGSPVAKRYHTSWTTPSIKFNKLFDIYTDNELKAAKFFKPKIVLSFENIANRFKNINFEVDGQRRACISFDKEDFLNFKGKLSLEDINAFENILKSRVAIKPLNHILDFFHTLMIYSDSNFKEE